MLHLVKACVISALVMLAGQQLPPDRPYELKGEAPGITTLKQFKVNHKHADCSNPTARQTSCQVYDGVSFAGVTGNSWKGCADVVCEGQGILANFVDGQLIYLYYGVGPGASEEIVKALKAKYGEPSEATKESATWKNSVGYLRVTQLPVPGSHGWSGLAVTTITSALNDTGQTKDI
jgi:hypothetical protein